jgi:hypothetical protein
MHSALGIVREGGTWPLKMFKIRPERLNQTTIKSIGTDVQRFYCRARFIESNLSWQCKNPSWAVNLCPHYHAVGYGQSE